MAPTSPSWLVRLADAAHAFRGEIGQSARDTPVWIRACYAALLVFIAAMNWRWLGWEWALGWFAALAFWECAIVRVLWPRLVSGRHDRRADLSFLVFVLGRALCHSLGWAPAWIASDGEADMIAAMIVAMNMLMAFSSFSHLSLIFWLIVGPNIAFTGAVLASRAHTLTDVLTLLAFAQLLVWLAASRRKFADLMNRLVSARTRLHAVEETDRAKTRFIATMSHELRTPLNAIIGYSEILEEEASQNGAANVETDAKRIKRSARHLLSTIDRVLFMSQLELGMFRPREESVHIGDLLRAAVDEARALAEARCNVLSLGQVEEIEVLADPKMLRESAVELVCNACVSTRGGAVRVSALLEAGRLRIRVVDTGVGIAHEDAERIFGAFCQLDNSETREHDGAGLGLAVMRRWARHVGGDVTLQSKIGEGSAFELIIPVIAADNDSVADPASNAA